MSEPTIIVALEEEYGYRYWVWHTGMTAEQLEVYWTKELDSVMPFFMHNMKDLPGRVVYSVPVPLTILEEDHEWTEEDFNKIERPTFCEIHQDKESNPIYWSSHIHMDDDSYLKKNDGTVLRHKGWKEEGEGTTRG